jgi:hypothetical protein
MRLLLAILALGGLAAGVGAFLATRPAARAVGPGAQDARAPVEIARRASEPRPLAAAESASSAAPARDGRDAVLPAPPLVDLGDSLAGFAIDTAFEGIEIDVSVVDAEGVPAPHAIVFGSWLIRFEMRPLDVPPGSEEGEAPADVAFRPTTHEAQCDQYGRVRLRLRTRLDDVPLTLRAHVAPYYASAGVVLDSTPVEPVVLRLEPPGALAVRLVDDSGAPVQGAHVRASQPRVTGAFGYTDAAGWAQLAEVPLGEVAISVQTPFGTQVQGAAEIVSGGLTSALLQADRGELRIAATGVVLDAYGRPLSGVRVRCGGETLGTEPDGSFTFWAAPTAEVSVEPDVGPWSPTYAPESRTVAFGASDLVFRSNGDLVLERLRIRVTDAASGARLGAQLLVIDPDEDPPNAVHPERRSAAGRPRLTFTVPDGVLERFLPLRPGTRLIVQAQGYADATVDPSLERGPLDVALRAGFGREFRLVDQATGAPLLAVDVTLGERWVGRTNREGRLWIRGAWEPGDDLLVRGFRPRAFNPELAVVPLQSAP